MATTKILGLEINAATSVTSTTASLATNIATTANIKTINSSSLIGSENIILPFNLICYGSEISGSTALTKSASFLLAANTLTSSNALIHIQWRGRKSSGTAGNTTLGLYNNTSDSTVGATYLGSNILTAAANRMGFFERSLLYNGDTGQISRPFPGTFSTDMGLNTLTYTSVSFNRAVDNYFIFTITNVNSADAGIIDFGMGTIYM
jgi:hypothetical protein